MNLRLNGQVVSVPTIDRDTPLLYLLRNDFRLQGPKFGCGLGQCGACTIHVNGKPTRSCLLPLSRISDGDEIVTLEGLGTPERPHPLQSALIDEQAVQCGYCINGMIMEAAALLKRSPHPTVSEIKAALANNLCRCGTHMRIVRAMRRAAGA
jgi:nicotinate dehydrogenase subunit A